MLRLSNKTNYFLGFAVVGLAATLAFWFASQHMEPQVKHYHLEPVEVFPLMKTYNFSANFRARESTMLYAEADGVFQRPLVRPGALVDQGQLLATLDWGLEEERYRIAQDTLAHIKSRLSHEPKHETQQTLLEEVEDLQLATSQLMEKTVTAPFSGQLGAWQVGRRTVVKKGTPLVHLYRTGEIIVEYEVPQKLHAKLLLEQPIIVNAELFDTKHWIAKIVQIEDDNIEPGENFIVRACFDNIEELALMGLPGKVSQTLIKDPEAIWIPEAAALTQEKETVVFVKKGTYAYPVEVTLGTSQRGFRHVKAGLEKDAEVVWFEGLPEVATRRIKLA